MSLFGGPSLSAPLPPPPPPAPPTLAASTVQQAGATSAAQAAAAAGGFGGTLATSGQGAPNPTTAPAQLTGTPGSKAKLGD